MKIITTILTTILLIATTVTAQDVYVAGFDNDGSSSNIAQIWEGDGTKHNLTSGNTNASANDVFVYNGDVYAAGSERIGTKSVAKIWKNGTAQNLTNGTQHASARSIFVFEGDVYAAGFENNGTNHIAKIWKNGNVQILSDGSKNAEAESIYISNGDVYVVGIEYDYSVDGNNVNSFIKLWKNGVAQNITNGVNSVNAKSVFVHNNDVYVAGNEYNGTKYIAKLWKNGNAQNLTTGTNHAYAESVFVTNGDVYVAGYDGTQPKLWINGVEETLNYDGNLDGGSVNSVYVSGSDVYAAGHLTESNGSETCNYAALWKNGEVELTSAAPGCAKNTGMKSVFVTEVELSIKKQEALENSFSVYPNPAQDALNINVQAPSNLQLYSLQGQLIQEIEVGQNTQVDISSLTPGIYFIKDVSTTQKTVKFIKE